MVVASLVAGRVRVRDDGLKREPLVSRVKEELLATPGVTSVEANPRVGSLLIIYSAAVAAVEKILKMVSKLLGSTLEAGGRAETAPEQRRIFARVPFGNRFPPAISPGLRRMVVNFGMLASLVLSLGAAILGFKKLHILTGIVFVALFGDHFYLKRGHMFAF